MAKRPEQLMVREELVGLLKHRGGAEDVVETISAVLEHLTEKSLVALLIANRDRDECAGAGGVMPAHSRRLLFVPPEK